MAAEIESRWEETVVVGSDGRIRARFPVPSDPRELLARIALRRVGALTPEEERAIQEAGAEPLRTRDRRIASHGVPFQAGGHPSPRPPPEDRAARREVLLTAAERQLAASWDPSVHLEEGVRALRDLDRAINLLGERVGSWTSRDRPELDPGDASRAARELLDPAPGVVPDPRTAPPESLENGRRALARAFRQLEAARSEIDQAIRSTAPDRTPNLSALLGPELAAQMVSAAGGLDRLSRLPASTVQVLGAEKAFFEHLRGRAPPPRHGLLFLHPRIQSSGRVARGRLARALAGKVAIAARLDRAGRGVDPSLQRRFEARAQEIAHRPGATRRRRAASPST